MLDLAALRATRTIITHENPDGPCADGRASALILLDALPDATVRFIAYNTPEHRALAAEPGMLFCDFTPYVERPGAGERTFPGRETFTHAGMDNLRRFIDAGAIVLDHHAGAQDIVAAFGERGVYSDEPGVSGATLAFREVWEALIDDSRRALIHYFADLVGIRDTWCRSNPRWREASALSAAIAFYPWEVLLSREDIAARWTRRFQLLEDVGEHLLVHEEARARRLLAGAASMKLGAHRVLLVEAGSHDTSNVSDLARSGDAADLVVGWSYAVEQGGAERMKLSLRSITVDCAAIAKRHGGGGHHGAAGCSVDVIDDASPYEQIRRLLTGAPW